MFTCNERIKLYLAEGQLVTVGECEKMTFLDIADVQNGHVQVTKLKWERTIKIKKQCQLIDLIKAYKDKIKDRWKLKTKTGHTINIFNQFLSTLSFHPSQAFSQLLPQTSQNAVGRFLLCVVPNHLAVYLMIHKVKCSLVLRVTSE